MRLGKRLELRCEVSGLGWGVGVGDARLAAHEWARRVLSRLNSAGVPSKQGSDVPNRILQNNWKIDLSYSLFVAFAMNDSGFMLMCLACFITLNDCSQQTVVGVIVVAFTNSFQSTD